MRFLPLLFLLLPACLAPALEPAPDVIHLDHDIDGGAFALLPDAAIIPDANGRSDAEVPEVVPGPENPHPDGRDPDAGPLVRSDAGAEDTGLDENGRPL